MAFELYVDTANRIGIEQEGFAFDLRPGVQPSDWLFEGTYAWPVPPGNVQPITLMPAQLDPEWATTAADTGPFARYRLSHFDLLDGSTAEEYPRLHDKDWVVLPKQETCTLRTKKRLHAGGGISYNFRVEGPQLRNEIITQLTFGHDNPDKQFHLTVREDGRGFLFRGSNMNPPPEDQLAEGWLVPRRWGTLVGKEWVRLFILPYGRNRLLITSSTGNGFVWEDEGITRASPPKGGGGAALLSATSGDSIVGAPRYGPVTQPGLVKAKTFKKMAVQLRPISYKGPIVTGANRVGGTIKPKYPSVISTVKIPLSSLLGPGLTTSVTADTNDIVDAQATYDPQAAGPEDKHVLNPTVTLSRRNVSEDDHNHTPFFYRLETKYQSEGVDRPALISNIRADVTQLEHNHSENGITGNVKVRFPGNHKEYARAFNLPFQIVDDNNIFLDALLISPTLDYTSAVPYVNSSTLSFEIQSKMKILESTLVADLTRLDGLSISTAVKNILISAGFPENGSAWIIDETPTLASGEGITQLSKAEADDEATNLSDAVRSVADWLRYIIETYTSSSEPPFKWVMGFQPFYDVAQERFVYKFFFRDPAKISTAPVKIWYPNAQIAMTASALGEDMVDVPYSQVHRTVHMQFHEEAIEPEANAVMVAGLGDKATPSQEAHEKESTSGVLKSYKEDRPSINPTTLLEDRPANWLGYKRMVVLVDSSLNTEPLVKAACEKLFNRLTRARIRATFKAQWEPTVKLWDKVTIWQHDLEGNLVSFDWRVTGYNVRHLQDTSDTSQPGVVRNREATYFVERWL